jgi:hypothetical protein
MDTEDYVDRMLEPVSTCLTKEVAGRLIRLQADPQVQARIDELADRCTEGALNEEERAEYETYVRVGNLIALLQAKARRLLATSIPA